MNTRITELFGIKYPILQSGMQWLATPELAAAVSKAGGLGIISATIFMVDSDPAATKAGLVAGLAKCRELADGHPFGLNISMLPHADYDNNTELFFRTAYEEHVPVIETSGNNPQAYYELLRGWEKEDGRDNEHDKIKLIHKCPSVRHALSAQKAGADAVTIVGFECAGHPGLGDVSTMALIPVAKEKLSIPVVAGGGICNRNTFVSAMALGADGVIMGTRFVATEECGIHPNWKQLIIDSTENDTAVLQYKVRNANRVWYGHQDKKNPENSRFSKTATWVKKTEAAWDLDAPHDKPLIAVLMAGDPNDEEVRGISGKNQRVCYKNGNINGCLFPMGLCVGQIHDIKTVQEVFDEVCGGAESVLEKLHGEFAD